MTTPKEIIQKALDRGQRALSEYESKQVLAADSVPVTREELATTADEAVDAAGRIGYPVVLKACSWRLMHKSDAGAVELNLRGEAEVRSVFGRITAAAGPEIDGVLVQEMVASSRELVVGLIRDPQFGPCAMLGMGGVLAEVLDDTVFRAAPLDMAEALDMISELRGRAMLDSFRGQAPADLEAIGQVLIAVGQIGVEHESVAEIDINPLMVDAQGKVIAADALVVLTGGDHD